MIGLSVPAIALAYLALQISVTLWTERGWQWAGFAPVALLTGSMVVMVLGISAGWAFASAPFEMLLPLSVVYLTALWGLRLSTIRQRAAS